MAPTVANRPRVIRGITQVAGAVPLSAQLMVGATIDQDPRIGCDRIGRPDNNKMQQTRHGQNGASLLILVLGGPGARRRMR